MQIKKITATVYNVECRCASRIASLLETPPPSRIEAEILKDVLLVLAIKEPCLDFAEYFVAPRVPPDEEACQHHLEKYELCDSEHLTLSYHFVHTQRNSHPERNEHNAIVGHPRHYI